MTRPCPGCGAPISANAALCKFCKDRDTMRKVPIKLENPDATHFLARLNAHFEELYTREGLLIATRQGDAVHYGEVIQEHQTRRFATYDAAQTYLRRIADMDIAAVAAGRWHDFATLVRNYRSWPATWGEKPDKMPRAIIEERNLEGLITLPGDGVGLTPKILAS